MKSKALLLAIDRGNTRVKIGVFSGGTLIYQEAFSVLSLNRLQSLSRRFEFSGAILSAVAPLPVPVLKFLKKLPGFLELSHRTPLPIRNAYKSPATLGRDRIAMAVAAAARYPRQHVLVIGAGTCITFDLVQAGGTYIGGSISPGLHMRFEALHAFTGGLPKVKLQWDNPLLGSDTLSSMRSGVMNGAMAEIREMVKEYKKMYPRLKVLITGGDAAGLAERLKINIFAAPDLVLYGLYEIYRYHDANR